LAGSGIFPTLKPKIKLVYMKRITLAICTATFLFVACSDDKKTEDKTASDTSSDSSTTKMDKMDKMDEKKPEAYTMPDSATMMKNWEMCMTPGKEHAMLAKSNGTWTAEVTNWMDPSKPPIKSKATTINKMLLGGRYQESSTNGTMMGMPFEGKGVTGYDNAKKVFVSTWVDNMGTGIMTMEGPWDEASKSITFKGKTMDPMTMRETSLKEIFKIVDDNNQLMEMYAPGPDGKELKMMEIKFTRKK
jgi:hypothetical protein